MFRRPADRRAFAVVDVDIFHPARPYPRDRFASNPQRNALRKDLA